MGLGDEIKAGAQDLVGKAKEKIGEATGDLGLQAEGVKDQVAADVTRASGEVKDVASDVEEAVTPEAGESLGDKVRAVGEKVKDFFDGDKDGDGSWKDK